MMGGLFRRQPRGITTGGQFATEPRADAPVRLDVRASNATAALRQLSEREGWRDAAAIASADATTGRAVTPGAGTLLQTHTSTVAPDVVLVELDPERPDPWARAAYYELHGEELSRVVCCPDGRRYRTFIASGVTGPAVLADELDAYLRRA